MARTIDSAVEAIINADVSKLVMLIKLGIDGGTYLRLNTSKISVYWNEGSGEEEYLGAGAILDLGGAEEGTELQSYGMDFTISGIPQEYINDAINLNWKNNPLITYLAALDTDNSVISGTNGPVVMFAGRVDNSTIKLGETATIGISATSRLADWERPRGGNFSTAHQTARYAKLEGLESWWAEPDDGFAYVEALKGKDLFWGGKHQSIGFGSTGGGQGRGVGGRRVP